jgi:hypothetical protein
MDNTRNAPGLQDARQPGPSPDPAEHLVPAAGKHAARPSEAERLELLHEDETRNDSRLLDRILDPVIECFTPEVARAIVDLRTDPLVIDELAKKSAGGNPTAGESLEYETCAAAIEFVSKLQAKARALLNRTVSP